MKIIFTLLCITLINANSIARLRRRLNGNDARCGSSWTEANGKCGVPCPSRTDKECEATGEKCWADLKSCSGPTVTTTNNSDNTSANTGGTVRCGKTWTEANDKCGIPCPSKTDKECEATGEKCWADLKACDTTVTTTNNSDNTTSNTGGTARCGSSWTEANGKCGTACPSKTDKECTNGEKCWADLKSCGDNTTGGNNDGSDGGNIFYSCTKPGKIVLTFDDGPNIATPEVLDGLKEAGLKAVFFINGYNIDSQCSQRPELIAAKTLTGSADRCFLSPSVGTTGNNIGFMKRAVAEGHEIGNHGYFHTSNTGNSADSWCANIDQGCANPKAVDFEVSLVDKVAKEQGVDLIKVFRPPYLDMNGPVSKELAKRGYSVMQVNLDTNDWRASETFDSMKNTILNALDKPASSNSFIVLQHDSYVKEKLNTNNGQGFAEWLKAIKNKALANGYEFVSADECIEGGPQKPKSGKNEGNLTWYQSYAPCCAGNPNFDPNADNTECAEFNACRWTGQFAYVKGKKSYEWVGQNNLIAFFSAHGDNGVYGGKCIELTKDKVNFVATIADTCGDSDCNGCCTRNAGELGYLVDVEWQTAMKHFKDIKDVHGQIQWQIVDCETHEPTGPKGTASSSSTSSKSSTSSTSTSSESSSETVVLEDPSSVFVASLISMFLMVTY